MTLDGIDTRGDMGHPRLNWIRWRLTDELLRRYYRDIGLEAGFGQLGVELYQTALWSPNCKRAPRYFGRLCANHVHSAIVESEDELGASYEGGTIDMAPTGVWPAWGDYVVRAIEALGLASAGVPGHDGCWHRRGKAIFPLVFRVSLLLRTAGEVGPLGMNATAGGEDGMLTYPSKNPPPESEYLVDLLQQEGEIAGSRPRGLLVRRRGAPWIAIRSDGRVLTRNGSGSIREMWLSGENELGIAREIESLAGWEAVSSGFEDRKDEVQRA